MEKQDARAEQTAKQTENRQFEVSAEAARELNRLLLDRERIWRHAEPPE
jgi:hypothetical protein